MSEISTSVDPIHHADDVNDTLHDVNSMSHLNKIRRTRKEYEFYKNYSSIELAKAEIQEGLFESYWFVHKTITTVKGQTLYYHCKGGSRAKGHGCPKVVQLITIESNGSATITQSQDDHIHSEEKQQQGLTSTVQQKVIEFESYGLKPAQILIQLRKFADVMPTKLQLSNFLNVHRKKSNHLSQNGTQICLNDILNFYENNKVAPSDPDKMFVADCYVDAVMENDELVHIFRIFFTTTRLLSLTKFVSYFFLIG